MKWKHYLILCLGLAVVTSAAVLYIPGLSATLEAQLIAFLSSNAG